MVGEHRMNNYCRNIWAALIWPKTSVLFIVHVTAMPSVNGRTICNEEWHCLVLLLSQAGIRCLLYFCSWACDKDMGIDLICNTNNAMKRQTCHIKNSFELVFKPNWINGSGCYNSELHRAVQRNYFFSWKTHLRKPMCTSKGIWKSLSEKPLTVLIVTQEMETGL